MDINEIGMWNFCPACGRPVMSPEFSDEDRESDSFNYESVRCSCCRRPWIACPCTPAIEGECRSINEEKCSDG